MSHTPGPWKSVQVGNTKVSQAIIAESETSFTLVATARPQPSERLGKQEDNARLIAAAPDLLKDCEELIYHMTRSMDCKHGDGFTYDFCPVAKARADIAKAKGAE
jgi:hypothetical protein